MFQNAFDTWSLYELLLYELRLISISTQENMVVHPNPTYWCHHMQFSSMFHDFPWFSPINRGLFVGFVRENPSNWRLISISAWCSSASAAPPWPSYERPRSRPRATEGPGCQWPAARPAAAVHYLPGPGRPLGGCQENFFPKSWSGRLSWDMFKTTQNSWDDTNHGPFISIYFILFLQIYIYV